MALFDIAANLRAPGQLQLDDSTYPSPWGSLESYLSRRMPVRWHAAELTVKWRSTDRLLSPMRTYCVLGYLLLNNNNNDCLLRLNAAIYRMAESQSYLQTYTVLKYNTINPINTRKNNCTSH